jgi:hypothetical protein
MRAVCCDRCGKFEKCIKSLDLTDKPRWVMFYRRDIITLQDLEYLFCAECAKSFNDFLEEIHAQVP